MDGETIGVLDHGYVKLVQAQATDLSVVAAARVSLGVTEEASKGERDDRRLIRYLIKHNHGTPFEHNLFTFLVKAPLFVVREWHRHRVGWSYNEVSARYTELEEEFYVPSAVRVPAASNRQGSVVADWPEVKQRLTLDTIRWESYRAFQTYHHLLSEGVARELARTILPLNTYTSFYASCNARSLMHFLNLRLPEDAQWEIRQYAQALSVLFAEAMPITAEEWWASTDASGPSMVDAALRRSGTEASTGGQQGT